MPKVQWGIWTGSKERIFGSGHICSVQKILPLLHLSKVWHIFSALKHHFHPLNIFNPLYDISFTLIIWSMSHLNTDSKPNYWGEKIWQQRTTWRVSTAKMALPANKHDNGCQKNTYTWNNLALSDILYTKGFWCQAIHKKFLRRFDTIFGLKWWWKVV